MILDLLLEDGYAVDADGVVWHRLAPGVWGRGFHVVPRGYVFLRPFLAGSRVPLPLEVFERFRAAARNSLLGRGRAFPAATERRAG